MSLVTSASTWTNDEPANKKRQSTMRKTIKMRPHMQSDIEPEEYISHSENYQNLKPQTIDDVQAANQDRNTRVNDLLNKITSSDASDDNKMGDFKPISHPSLNVRRDNADSTELPKYVPQIPSFASASIASKTDPDSKHQPSYGADDLKSNIYSNYNKSYEPPAKLVSQPYYAKMGIGSAAPIDNKLMEKINYMIHMMEAQQHEKTNNITEEFILYSFLGIFIIYVVDSFARAGKYTR